LHNSEIKRISRAKDYFQVLDVDRGASKHELEKAHRRCLIRIQFSHHGAGSENAIKVVEEAYVTLQDPARRDRYLRKAKEASESAVLNSSSKNPSSSEQKVVITRVRRLPKRHGFVAFCREGQATMDFRLGIVTHEADLNNIRPDMMAWVEQAWRDRTPDQLLVFPPPGRFLMMNIRYKETETYVTEDWKFRISHATEGDRNGTMGNKRWECGLSSRWFKWNDGITGGRSMESILKNDVVALVKEAVKFSEGTG
jgi:curved DNA-binding protein CbpA